MTISVCLWAHISKSRVRTRQNYLYMLSVVLVTQSICDDEATCCELTVLC